MASIPASTTPPRHRCSPGLEKLIRRLAVVDDDKFDEVAVKRGNTKMVYALAADRALNEPEVLDQVASDLGLDFHKINLYEFADYQAEMNLPSGITRRFCLEHRFFPIKRDGDQFTIAMADPLDIEAINEIEFVTTCPVKVVVSTEADIITAVEKFVNDPDQDLPGHLMALEGFDQGEQCVDIIAEHEEDPETAQQRSEYAPIVRLVNKILLDAAGAEASDVHLEPTSDSLDVRMRIDGVMQHHATVPRRLLSYVIARIKILAGMDITERRRPQDGRFRVRLGKGSQRDVRVSTVPTPFGESVVIRLLRSQSSGLDFDSLNFPQSLRSEVEEVLAGRDRIVVVTGPTGSGKTTTLYACINHLKGGTTNIVTVEDPIEFMIAGATQIQVDTKVGITFASGLRSILRQDPDVILVGEIRDAETAEIAFQAAQTGHLVLSTLHTNSAPAAVTRLIDLGVPPFIAASSLSAVIAQRLVRRVCDSCARPLTAEEAEAVKKRFDIESDEMRIGHGCQDCDYTGYRGREAVISLLRINQAVREAIRDGADEDEIAKMGKSQGMKDLQDAALELLAKGVTTVAEIGRVVGLERSSKPSSGKNGLAKAAAIPPIPVSSNRSYRLPTPGAEIPSPAGPVNTMNRELVIDDPASLRTGSIASLASEVTDEEKDDKDLEGVKVLVVDDDACVRAVMTRSLRKFEFAVFEASNGYDAIQKVSDHQPDVIVCDLFMPGMDGKELMTKLKQSAETAQIPVLMLTGSDSEENEIDLISSGADDFLSKTCSPAVVVARIRRLLA